MSAPGTPGDLEGAGAFSFSSPRGLPAMKARLDAGPLGPWREGDSAYFDYLAVRIGASGASLRLYPDGARFVIEMRRGLVEAALRALVLERLLPLLDAADVRPDPGFD